MSLVNTRAAFEKAVTDAVAAADNTVQMVYDNVSFITPGKTKKYISMSISFSAATLQNQGAASDYYSGVIQCNVYVPKSKGTYNDLFNCKPRVLDINGPTSLEVEERSHFIGIISCQFTANA